jgi:hypothetical protein
MNDPWNVLAASLQGTSHTSESIPCQDCHAWKLVSTRNEQVLLISCSDGAGSANYADVGSKLACDASIACLEEFVLQYGGVNGLDRTAATSMCERVRAVISDEAAQRNVSVRQLACTLLCAAVSESGSFFFQVGDGAIVASTGVSLGVVFWPQSGEYANSTTFITDEQYYQSMQCECFIRAFKDVAVFTDGLERLLLDFSKRTPHLPFFENCFGWVRAATNVESLQDGFQKLLNSNDVNQRTDDDKTLVLASRLSAR